MMLSKLIAIQALTILTLQKSLNGTNFEEVTYSNKPITHSKPQINQTHQQKKNLQEFEHKNYSEVIYNKAQIQNTQNQQVIMQKPHLSQIPVHYQQDILKQNHPIVQQDQMIFEPVVYKNSITHIHQPIIQPQHIVQQGLPVVQNPIVQQQIIKQSQHVVQQPIVQQPIIQQPIAQQHVQQPIIQQHVQQPIIQQPIPIAQQPIVQQQQPIPIAQQPIVQQQQPIVQQQQPIPIAQQPIVQQQQPIIQQQQPIVQQQQPIVQQDLSVQQKKDIKNNTDVEQQKGDNIQKQKIQAFNELIETDQKQLEEEEEQLVDIQEEKNKILQGEVNQENKEKIELLEQRILEQQELIEQNENEIADYKKQIQNIMNKLKSKNKDIKKLKKNNKKLQNNQIIPNDMTFEQDLQKNISKLSQSNTTVTNQLDQMKQYIDQSLKDYKNQQHQISEEQTQKIQNILKLMNQEIHKNNSTDTLESIYEKFEKDLEPDQ